MPEPTPADFYVNAAAGEFGLSTDVWHQAYILFMREAKKEMSFDSYQRERTVRVPSAGGPVDVLVRCQPDPREVLIFRFTAFPAGPGLEVHQLSREYRYDGEIRPILGEAALLDEGASW